MDNATYHIYALINPITHKPFYIGCTDGFPIIRITYHIAHAKRQKITAKTPKYAIDKRETILNIVNSGNDVQWIILYTTKDRAEASEKEQLLTSLLLGGKIELYQRSKTGYNK